MTIQSQLNNRPALKYNHILMERKDIWVSGHGANNVYSMERVQMLLNEGYFEDYVTVVLSSESGSFGPDMQPSPLRVKKLMRLLKKTDYHILKQEGQTFLISGVN